MTTLLERAVALAWGPPLIVVLIGGGAFLLVASRLLPLRGLGHALAVVSGRYDSADDPGEISHFQALSTALAATIGLGNVGGVAIAITQGGPGAVFWMWLAAVVGMATKFFTCTLAVMYRSDDGIGPVRGGPMHTIANGLGRRWRPLATMFAVCGTVGCLALFQSNQMAEILVETAGLPRWLTGLGITALAAGVILGGLRRIAIVASRLVPAMCILYLACAVAIAITHAQLLPGILAAIFHDAFTGSAATGGVIGVGWMTVVQVGVKRAAFSNEAGIGTAPMAHGVARTTEPVREGLVAMLGPLIDTIGVCSLTAFVILAAGGPQGGEVEGVALTASAFESALGPLGVAALILIVTMFGLSTIFGYAYYGRTCLAYLVGERRSRVYEPVYVGALFLGAIWSASTVVNLVDTGFALMAFPNMLATLVLSPRVLTATRDYFGRMRAERGRRGR